jgi:D-alanine--D-alanine ligase
VETDRLRAEGIEVWIGHSGNALLEGDALVLSDAIDLSQSPEVFRAREIGVPLFRRSQLLGWLVRDHKVIGVTGTHGKTTTTGLLGAGLRAAGLDPLIVVGASIPEWNGPVVEGSGEWAVVEACEAYDALVDLEPTIAVLTNLEPDHLDFHGDWESLRASVRRFVDRAKSVVYVESDAGSREVLEEHLGDVYPVANPNGRDPSMTLPGHHNRQNMKLAIRAIELVGADVELAREGMRAFSGAERRLQVHLDSVDLKVVDDYAHHPTEIVASLSALRERFPGYELWVVYQPHLYSRTAEHLSEFATSLGLADFVFLTDIYPAREAPIPGVSSARIADQLLVPFRYVPSRHLLPRLVARRLEQAEGQVVVVGMGAGTISEFVPGFLEEWKRYEPGRKRRIAVILGGDSSEREVSLLSGNAIARALMEKQFEVDQVDVTELLLRTGDLERFVGPQRPDLAFLAVHGTHAEDGAIQGLFELLDIAYTGSGIQSSALAMDKESTRKLLQLHGLPVAKGRTVVRGRVEDALGDEFFQSGRFVVKPNAEGSTVGLTFVEHPDQLIGAIEKAHRYGDVALVEEWLLGMEISVPVLVDVPLPPVEIVPASGTYDFEAKYTPGATQEVCPARLPDSMITAAQQLAMECHHALGCDGATRVDMIVTERGPVVLEINTLPGMTGTSLLPNSAASAGICFAELVERIAEDAMARHARRT